jgi:gliding motility-associated-like protein
MTSRYLLFHILLISALFPALSARAQCTSTISIFPYSEDFEVDDGNWTTGGGASDWVWGTPTKHVINRASSGIRCWVTGGLQNTLYNENENSWLMSPCFDFTGVANPYIHFMLFWETERKYDGANLEYSIDGGNNWLVVGSNADNNACPGSNWFNTSTITTLGADGWSGNIQATAPCPGGAGSGSGSWVAAGHALPNLSGRANVRFRFRFAAGNRCNDYDGFAVDDIWVGELAAADAQFSFSCGSSRTAAFTPVTVGCGNIYTWNFGDPPSGGLNTAVGANPSHTFSQTGIFNVTLTVTSGSGAFASVTKPVHIVDVTVSELSPVRCNGGTEGSLTALVTPAGSYTYLWSTVPAQSTVSIAGLRAGTYTVEVRGTDVCVSRGTGALTDPAPITHTQTVWDARCGGANGRADLVVGGGNTPYAFSWSPSGSSGASSTTLLPGDYSVSISDAQGCTDTARFNIGDNTNFSITLGPDTVLCAGETILLYPGPFAAYSWQDGSHDTAYRVTQTGVYSVRVVDVDGCVATDAAKVTVDCSDVQFPNAFTPNGNGRNDYFGPMGNPGALSAYSLRVYGRWGQLVFQTTNPFEQWDGRTAGMQEGTQVYVWIAQYQLQRHAGVQTRKGTVLLMR